MDTDNKSSPVRVLILGAGGQGQVLADTLLFAAEAGRPVVPVGYLDDNPHYWQSRFLGLPVFGPFDVLDQIAHDAVILGIGSNRMRSKIFEGLLSMGRNFVSVQHPTAVVGHDVQVGPGSYIGPYVVIAAGSVIGANVIINGHSLVGHHNCVADHVHIAPGVSTAGEVVIGTGTVLGIGSKVLSRRKIGQWSVVGGSALVQRDVLPGETVIGVPARPLVQKQLKALP